MVIENQINCECARASPVDDGDGITYCENCGVELNSLLFDDYRTYTEDIRPSPSATAKLPRRLQIQEMRTHTPRFRAMHAAGELVRLVHPNPDSIQKVALEYVELGWDESTTLLKAEPHLCRFGHPHGVEYVAASCLYLARRESGVCSDRIQLVEQCLDGRSVCPSTRKINRTVKSLKKRIRLKRNHSREQDNISFVRPLVEQGITRFPELGLIRQDLITHGEQYCRTNSIRSGNPLTLISALAYVLQRNAGIGLSREEIRCAFGSNTTMGHLIPRMKNFVAQGNAGLVRTTNSHIQGVSI